MSAVAKLSENKTDHYIAAGYWHGSKSLILSNQIDSKIKNSPKSMVPNKGNFCPTPSSAQADLKSGTTRLLRGSNHVWLKDLELPKLFVHYIDEQTNVFLCLELANYFQTFCGWKVPLHKTKSWDLKVSPFFIYASLACIVSISGDRSCRVGTVDQAFHT